LRDLRASGKMASCGRGAGGGTGQALSASAGGFERDDARSRDAAATRRRSTPGRFRERREANAATSSSGPRAPFRSFSSA
jgi:hypothetical protein